MTAPVLQVLVDMASDGSFGDAGDDVSADLVGDVNWTRGRSADFSGDATGAATFTLDNTAGTYYPSAGLIAGRPVLIQSTWGGTTRAHFFGYVQRVTPDAALHGAKTVTVTCYDPLQRMAETQVVVPANAYVQRTARDMRVEVLSDYERGVINLCDNGSVETAITGWAIQNGGTSVTQIGTDAAPGLGTHCVQFVAASANTRCEFPLRLAPVFFAGQTYRCSVYLKSTAGTAAWTVGLYGGTWSGAGIADRLYTVTAGWARYTFTVTLPTTYTASGGPLTFFVLATGAGTILADGLMVSRGYADPAYTAAISGRWPNFCGSGSFDAGALSGWYDGFANLCGNGGFEANVAGWSGGAVARSTAQHYYGAACASYSASNAVTYNLSGTFKAGQRYDFQAAFLNTSAGSPTMTLKVASIGTPADAVTVTNSSTPVSTWAVLSGSWTPSADRADAQITIQQSGGTCFTDGVQIVRRDAALGAQVYPYGDTGPAGGGSFVTTRATSTTAKYGSRSQSAATPATAGAGRVYDFNHYGAYFLSGRAYTASVWLNPSSAMPYKVALSANKGDGTFDEASATGTASANAWTQVTVTWTPGASYSSAAALSVLLSVLQTDATARTVLIDGVRVIPGSSADNFEEPWWNLTQEPDVYATSASLSGSAQSALSTLNGLTLTRHYIKPMTTAPFYQYVTSSRDDLPAKASAETIADAFSGFSALDVDRNSIVNLVAVSFSGNVEYYDAGPADTSIATYGVHPGNAISGGAFFPDRTIPDIVGPALVARYKEPRARPVMVRANDDPNTQLPAMLDRELDDLVTVSLARLGISSKHYLIVRIDGKASASGKVWSISHGLEEDPY